MPKLGITRAKVDRQSGYNSMTFYTGCDFVVFSCVKIASFYTFFTSFSRDFYSLTQTIFYLIRRTFPHHPHLQLKKLQSI